MFACSFFRECSVLMNLANFRKCTVLVAEDNPHHALLIKRAFRLAGLKNPVYFAADGAEAIRYLAGDGQFEDRLRYPIPVVMLVDLRMPKISGLELLEWVRKQRHLEGLMTAVVTSMRELPDVARAFEFGANAYLVKPVSHLDLGELMERFSRYWNREPIRNVIAGPSSNAGEIRPRW